ncbi:MAG: hypothetical protein AB1442_15025 [Nitrospirota bacterium]
MTDEIIITPQEFIQFEESNSSALKNEWLLAKDPVFRKYECSLLSFIAQDVYPTYRTDKAGLKLTGAFEDKEAIPITFHELSKRQDLCHNIIREGYRNKGNAILAYHCFGCNVYVIKDGIHRLIQWAVNREDRTIIVYQVSSKDWSDAKIDMPNFCRCIKKT